MIVVLALIGWLVFGVLVALVIGPLLRDDVPPGGPES